MGVWGGIVGIGGQKVEGDRILRMSRGLLPRGGSCGNAYIRPTGGMFFHGGGELPLQEFPTTGEVGIGGGLCVATADGPIRGEELLRAYGRAGVDGVSRLREPFALAIWEESRGELLLARDRSGSRPLFYAVLEDSVAFCSEIKGILPLLAGGGELSSDRLRAYLKAPDGALWEETLYRGISRLPVGYCALGTRLGLKTFPHSHGMPRQWEIGPADLRLRCYCPPAEELRQILRRILYAFDMPRFDPWMPDLLRQAEGGGDFLTVEDHTPERGRVYAAERAHRLGTICGAELCSLPSAERPRPDRELKRLERTLWTLAEEEGRFLSELLGREWRRELRTEGDPFRRVERLGMLCQLAPWIKGYGLRLR